MPSVAPADRFVARYRAVREALDAAEVDAFIVTSLPNVFYLTGFSGSAGILLIEAARVTLLTDSRYVTAVEAQLATSGWPDGAMLKVEGSYDEALARWVGTLSPGSRVGFEADHLSVGRFTGLERRIGSPGRSGGETGPRSSVVPDQVPSLVPTHDIVEGVRVRKDAHEVAILRRAAEMLSAVARDVLRTVPIGSTELQAAAEIDYKLKRAGFSAPAFDTIVAGGERAALPHAHPGERVLGPQDLLLLDFGGVYDGYCVDLTRTICLGHPTEEMRRVHHAVRDAQRAAIDAVRSGVLSSDVDAAARTLLAERGLGQAFGHGTGHGLGVEVHESPRIAARRPEVPETRLQSNMVFTVEPGAYLPGWGGVRIEDDVLVTARGCDVLTDVPNGLTVG